MLLHYAICKQYSMAVVSEFFRMTVRFVIIQKIMNLWMNYALLINSNFGRFKIKVNIVRQVIVCNTVFYCWQYVKKQKISLTFFDHCRLYIILLIKQVLRHQSGRYEVLDRFERDCDCIGVTFLCVRCSLLASCSHEAQYITVMQTESGVIFM